MITPQQILNPQVKPKWQLPVGVMESVVAFNCRKYGMPRPVLAMPMWEGAGNRAIDLSGKGNHGSINGADWVAGGLNFVKANSDYVDAGTAASLNMGSGDLTIMTRFKSPNFVGLVALAAKGGAYAGGKRYLVTNELASSGSLYIVIDDNTSSRKISSTNTLDDDQEHCVVGVRDGNYLRLYVDGYEDAHSPLSISGYGNIDSTRPCTIGSIYNESTSSQDLFFGGDIYDVCIFNVALSAAQVKFFYDNPYFMYEIPEKLYGYVSAVAAEANPYWYYQMLKRRN